MNTLTPIRYHFSVPITGLVMMFLFGCSSDNTSQQVPENMTVVVRTLGGAKNESAQSVVMTQDGGYAVLGFTQSNDEDLFFKPNESYDYWLLKFDEESNIEWQKTYGGSAEERAYDLIQTSDGGFVMMGYSKSSDGDVSENNGFQDFWVVKLTSTGNLQWEKSFGFSGADIGETVIETHDNGYLITGVLDVSASNGQGNNRLNQSRHAGGDYWVIKLDTGGNMQWSRYFGGSFTDTAYDVIQTHDNGYIIVGSSDSNDVDVSNNLGTYDFWVIKISENGTLEWEHTYGGSQIDEARAIVQSNDGHFMIVGDTRSDDLNVNSNKGGGDLWVIKIDTNGTLIWEKTYGGSSFDTGRSISTTHDNGFIISGNSRSLDMDLKSNQGQNDAWIIKIDSEGKLIQQHSIGGSEIDSANDAIELNDSTIIVVGESNSNNDSIVNKGFTDLLIIEIK